MSRSPPRLRWRRLRRNVTRVVQIGCELDSARRTVDLIEKYPQVLGGVALHPSEASELAAAGVAALEDAFAEIEKLAGHPRVRVVGETGLDHHWIGADDVAGRAAAEHSFRWHIALPGGWEGVADLTGRMRTYCAFSPEGAPERCLHVSPAMLMARYCVDQGWYLSFAGPLTFKNGVALREALRVVPLDRVLVETDAPYLAPTPYRGKTNASYLVPLTVRRMAEVLALDLDTLCAWLDATAEALYGPW
jgi:TatD DNase family protein